MGGVKLRLMHPTDKEIQEKFKSYNVVGSIEAHLANFGQYQFGTSIQASVYLPTMSPDGCVDIRE